MRRIVSLLIAGALAVGIAAPVAARSGPTIVDIASSSSDFEILTAAVGAAGLDGLLDGRRQFTVFAPTDDAFLALEAACPGIIGALPPIVMILVYLTTPDYISLLWTHPTGQLMLVGCVIWMSLGILVMKKMINFDF